jgi:hypothetical protein
MEGQRAWTLLIWGSENENSPIAGDDAVIWGIFSGDTPVWRIAEEARLGVNSATFQEIAQVALGMCYYLSSTNAQTESVPLQTSRSRGRRNPSSPSKVASTVTWIAKRFEEARETRSVTPRASVEGRDAPRQHWVRGHFRHYWTGPRKGDRVRIRKFIAPFLRGDEAKGVLVRDAYMMQEDR